MDVLEGILQYGFSPGRWEALLSVLGGGLSSGPMWSSALSGAVCQLDSP